MDSGNGGWRVGDWVAMSTTMIVFWGEIDRGKFTRRGELLHGSGSSKSRGGS